MSIPRPARLLPALLLTLTALPAFAEGGAPGSHFIENWDLDGNGTVTLSEATQKRADIFYMFDQNEDGMLDAAEYDLFDETRAADRAANAAEHGNGGMNRADGGMAREASDSDGDGQVTAAEFAASTKAWFDGVDSSGDGVVTPADFGPGARGSGKGNGMGKGMGQPKG